VSTHCDIRAVLRANIEFESDVLWRQLHLNASREVETRADASAPSSPKYRVFGAIAGIFLLNVLLRVFYTRYQFVNGDEAIRALTALKMLEGGRLYVDVMTDKPPGASFFYLGIFSLFNHSMAAVHLALIVWNFGTAAALYSIAKRLYSRSVGLCAALLFVVFSANYFPQDMMAANTELLLALPYTLAFWAWARSASERRQALDDSLDESVIRIPEHGLAFPVSGSRGDWTTRQPFLWLFVAGSFAAIATLFKQIGILNLVVFTVLEAARVRVLPRPGFPIASVDPRRRPDSALYSSAIARVMVLLFGFATPIAITAGWLVYTGATHGFWRNTVALELFYVNSLPARLWLKFMVTRTFGYILFNLALWALAGAAIWRTVATVRRGRHKLDELARERAPIADLAIALWGLVSLAGVFASGRFYGHYFIPVLPALALLGARGMEYLHTVSSVPRVRNRVRTAGAVLSVLFLFGFLRFHLLTAALAYEAVTGRSTNRVANWGATKREREAAAIGNQIRNEIGEGGYLYIWGYALDVYWRSRCRPASRFLTPYYVTGDFYPEVTASSVTNKGPFWDQARASFIEDLRKTEPSLILNIDEPIESLPYREIVDYVNQNYVRDGVLGSSPDYQFVVYRRRSRT